MFTMQSEVTEWKDNNQTTYNLEKRSTRQDASVNGVEFVTIPCSETSAILARGMAKNVFRGGESGASLNNFDFLLFFTVV